MKKNFCLPFLTTKSLRLCVTRNNSQLFQHRCFSQKKTNPHNGFHFSFMVDRSVDNSATIGCFVGVPLSHLPSLNSSFHHPLGYHFHNSSCNQTKSISSSRVTEAFTSPMKVHKSKIQKSELRKDESQIALTEKLERLFIQLRNYDRTEAEAIIQKHKNHFLKNESFVSSGESHSDVDPQVYSQEDTATSTGGGNSWFSTSTGRKAKVDDVSGIFKKKQIIPHPQSLPRSLYVYGGVGCGKTMLMDIFYHCVKTDKKLRTHFNSFMHQFHQRMHEMRQKERKADHVPQLIDEIVSKYWLLCFDEFQVTDIADAMILKRLFEGLMDRGVVIVATSNRPPDGLYEHGLNREVFLPFIDFLKVRCDIHDMESANDYRLSGTLTNVYLTPHTENHLKIFDDLFSKLTHNEITEPDYLQVMGRVLVVPEAARGVAKFSFKDLCKKELGPADFIAIAKEYHTVFISDIPILTMDERDQVRRFILLIDELYQHKVKLVVTAAAPPRELFNPASKKEDGSMLDSHDEVFAFDRTVSRLSEMQSRDYLELPHTYHENSSTVTKHV